jgi:hypothetical protein
MGGFYASLFPTFGRRKPFLQYVGMILGRAFLASSIASSIKLDLLRSNCLTFLHVDLLLAPRRFEVQPSELLFHLVPFTITG